MWIIKLFVTIFTGFILIFGILILLIPCFITWEWRKPYNAFTTFIDALDDAYFPNDKINTTVD